MVIGIDPPELESACKDTFERSSEGAGHFRRPVRGPMYEPRSGFGRTSSRGTFGEFADDYSAASVMILAVSAALRATTWAQCCGPPRCV